MSAFSKLGTPIARINAAHSGAAASATSSDQAGGLEPVIFLARNAKNYANIQLMVVSWFM